MAQFYFPATPNIDPTADISKSLRDSQNFISNTLDRYQKDDYIKQQLAQQEFKNNIASSQLAIQQAAADRAQEIHDKAIAQQNAINQTMQDPNVGLRNLNTSDEATINSAFNNLNNKYKGINVEDPNSVAGKAYAKDLDAINTQLFKSVHMTPEHYADGSTVQVTDGMRYGTQNQVAKTIEDKLLSEGVDYAKAHTIASVKAQSLVPSLSADQAKREEDMAYKKAKLQAGKGDGNTVNIGTGVNGTGADKKVVTDSEAVELLDKIVDKNDDGNGFKAYVENTFGAKPAVASNMWDYIAKARASKASDYGIAKALQESIHKNWFLKDTLPKIDTFVKLAKASGTKSYRETYKSNTQNNFLKALQTKSAVDTLDKTTAAVEAQANPNFDRGLATLESMFKGQTYKDPIVTSKSKSLFTGKDPISQAMNSSQKGLIAKLSVEDPKAFNAFYSTANDAQKKALDKVLNSKDSKKYFNSIEETVPTTEKENKSSSQFTSGLDILQDAIHKRNISKGLPEEYNKTKLLSNPTTREQFKTDLADMFNVPDKTFKYDNGNRKLLESQNIEKVLEKYNMTLSDLKELRTNSHLPYSTRHALIELLKDR